MAEIKIAVADIPPHADWYNLLDTEIQAYLQDATATWNEALAAQLIVSLRQLTAEIRALRCLSDHYR